MIGQASGSVTGPTWSADEHYHQAILNIQRGEWQAALQALARLREGFPDEEDLEQLYDEVRFKADLDARRAAWLATCTATRRERRRAGQAATLGVALMVFLVGLFVFQQQVHPIFTESRSAAEQRRHLQAGAEALAAGDAAVASTEFEAVLAEVPNHPGASEGLARARQQLALASLYDEGVQLAAQGHWEEARARFEEVIRQDPQYRDTTQQLREVQTRIQLAQLLQSGKAAFQAQNWRGTIEDLETLRRLDADYARETVEEYLYVSYLERARGLLMDSGDSLTAVQTAVGLFDSALKLRPQSAEVQAEYRLANVYLEGLTFAAAQRWADAVARFQAVYDAQPAFANKHVAPWLISALVKQGDALVASNEFELSVGHYRQALTLANSRLPEDIAEQVASYTAQAETHARRGAFQRAIPYYQQAVELVHMNTNIP